jgi:raffinose/stachyose/melibiose transport system permease protein
MIRRRSRRERSLAPNYVILILLVVFSLGPLLVLLSNSLKSSGEVGRNPLGLPREGLAWRNYVEAWRQGDYAITIRNSLIVSLTTIVGVCLISGLAAFALAKLNLSGADVLTMYFLVGSSLPAQLFLVPLYFIWARLHLVDNLLGVIIIYWAVYSPFATFLLRSYMVSIPSDFEDAARVDGASEWQVFSRIIVPLTWPGFLTAGLVVGLWAWNEFLFAVTFLHRPEVMTVTTSYYNFAGRYGRDWGLTSAAAIIMIFPVVALFLALQRRFIEGLTEGGLKT